MAFKIKLPRSKTVKIRVPVKLRPRPSKASKTKQAAKKAQKRAEEAVRTLLAFDDPLEGADVLTALGYSAKKQLTDLIVLTQTGSEATKLNAHKLIMTLVERMRKQAGLQTRKHTVEHTEGGVTQRVSGEVGTTASQVSRAMMLLRGGMSQHKLSLYTRDDVAPPPKQLTANTENVDEPAQETHDQEVPPQECGPANPGHRPPTRFVPGGGLAGLPPGESATLYGRQWIAPVDSAYNGPNPRSTAGVGGEAAREGSGEAESDSGGEPEPRSTGAAVPETTAVNNRISASALVAQYKAARRLGTGTGNGVPTGRHGHAQADDRENAGSGTDTRPATAGGDGQQRVGQPGPTPVTARPIKVRGIRLGTPNIDSNLVSDLEGIAAPAGL